MRPPELNFHGILILIYQNHLFQSENLADPHKSKSRLFHRDEASKTLIALSLALFLSVGVYFKIIVTKKKQNSLLNKKKNRGRNQMDEILELAHKYRQGIEWL